MFNRPLTILVIFAITLGLVVSVTTGQQMYFADEHLDNIQRATLSETGVQVMVQHPGGSNPQSIALDLGARKMYWCNQDGGGGNDQGAILCADMDVVDPVITTLVSSPHVVDPKGIALDLSVSPPMMYFTDEHLDNIQRATLSGTGVQVMVQHPGGSNPQSIALDLGARKMYWCNQDGGGGNDQGAILCADMDVVDPVITTLVSSPHVVDPKGIALDLSVSPPMNVLYRRASGQYPTSYVKRDRGTGDGPTPRRVESSKHRARPGSAEDVLV